MGFLNNLGAVTILMLCGLFFAGIFAIFPLPYFFSARILKIESRSYWKAFGTSLISLVVLGLFAWLLGMVVTKLGWPEYTLLIALVVIHLVAVTALILWIYHISLGKALGVWLLALPFNLIIVVVIVLIIWLGLGETVFGILKGLDYTKVNP